MINELDIQLKEWILTIIKNDYQISFEHPGKIDNVPTISIYLYKLSNSLPTSPARETSFQITLSYLLTVQSDNQIDSHLTLGSLLLAAKEQSNFEVEFPPLPTDYWQSFGTPPLPYFIICLPLVKKIPNEKIPTIKQQPKVNLTSINNIRGIILGPNNHPISKAKVTMDHSKAFAYTDNSGSFSIATDLKSLNKFNCKIDAKGKKFSISIPMPKTLNAPIKIHLDNLEV